MDPYEVKSAGTPLKCFFCSLTINKNDEYMEIKDSDDSNDFHDYDDFPEYGKPACRVCFGHIMYERSKHGSQHSSMSSSMNSSRHSEHSNYTARRVDSRNDQNLNSYIYYLIGAAVIVATSLLIFRAKSEPVINVDVVSAIKAIKGKYPFQEHQTWREICDTIDRGITSVSSLILLYKEDDHSSTVDCLAKEIASLNTELRSLEKSHITFKEDPQDQTLDYGILLEKYSLQISEGGSMIVQNLNQVSINTSRIFHALCDRVTPKVKPAFIIFTLRYDNQIKDQKANNIAMRILRRSWNTLPEDVLAPLLSRIVTNAVKIAPESSQNSC